MNSPLAIDELIADFAAPASPPANGSGTRPLFFSGGTAINDLARALAARTRHSIHLVPPFDSGGSSARLRQAFEIPAVGDLRSRLLAVSDPTVPEARHIAQMYDERLDKGSNLELLRERIRLCLDDPAISRGARDIIHAHSQAILQALPANFPLAGASIGNLLMSGAWLSNGHDLDLTAAQTAALLQARGDVRCISQDTLHLAARLDDGRQLIGQHRLTGKEVAPLDSAINETWLCLSDDDATPVTACLPETNRQRILSAELIVFAPGSFHTSLMPHFLIKGVDKAIEGNPCARLYIPSLGRDPELHDTPPSRALEQLTRRLGTAGPNLILVDTSRLEDFAAYPHGPKILHGRLINPDTGYYDPRRLAGLLDLLCDPALQSRLLG